jgi:hypothetical protein
VKGGVFDMFPENFYKKGTDGIYRIEYGWSFTRAVLDHQFESPFKQTHTFGGKPIEVFDDYRSRYVTWRYDFNTIKGAGTVGGHMPKAHPDYQKFKPIKRSIRT